ncbi:hypothetical protein N9L02_00760 [Gammaproteobacteria bacterium]|nr:hypothetical protein [Gammaproteobacteria bacterium]
MFDRLQRPFLTVETGEAYQPVRLTYKTDNKEEFVKSIEKLDCIQKNAANNSWSWYWQGECKDQHFASVDSYKRNSETPLRLGTLIFRDNAIFLNLPSFKRACLAVPFFNKVISDSRFLKIVSADFINKVFALDERLPHGFTELFKDEELDRILNERISDYEKVKTHCEQASTAEEAFSILSKYTKTEGQKKLPYAERYMFDLSKEEDMDVVFLAFYIYLRGREMVAIKRWFGQTGYTLSDAADETVEKVFGGIGLDLLD